MTGPGTVTEGTRTLTLAGPFALESGAALPELTIAYRTWGRLASSSGRRSGARTACCGA